MDGTTLVGILLAAFGFGLGWFVGSGRAKAVLVKLLGIGTAVLFLVGAAHAQEGEPDSVRTSSSVDTVGQVPVIQTTITIERFYSVKEAPPPTASLPDSLRGLPPQAPTAGVATCGAVDQGSKTFDCSVPFDNADEYVSVTEGRGNGVALNPFMSTDYPGASGVASAIFTCDTTWVNPNTGQTTTSYPGFQLRAWRKWADDSVHNGKMVNVPVPRPASCSGGTPPDPTPTPPGPVPSPPSGANLSLDFDDPNDLGVTCGFAPCNFPWRKHDYWPTGGVNGTGAINMHWFPGMNVGSSPVNITVPMTPHFRIRYAARQSAEMQYSTSAGTAQKMMRLSVGGGTKIGMIESKRGNFCWHWDAWDTSHTIGCRSIGLPTFNDNRWHIYEIEMDYRNLAAITATISFDGVVARTFTFDGRAAGNLLGNGPLTISPIVEMYSCGVVSGPCPPGMNTGDYTVDDFSFTVLP